MRRPRLLPVVAASLLLAGCGLQKPSPVVSVVSGGHFVHSEAVQFCFEGQDPEAEPGSDDACSTDERRPQVVRVTPGEQVGVDVAKDLAEGGWQVAIGPAAEAPQGQQQQQEETSGVLEGHYFSFVPQFAGGAPLRLRVRAVEPGSGKGGQQPEVRGVWEFVLAPQ